MTQEDCLPFSLKAFFRATQKVYPNISWNGTMQQTQLPAFQSNSPFQNKFRKSNTLWDGTSSYLLAPATSLLQQQLPLLHWWPLPCRSSNQSCTSDQFLHQQIPAITSSAPAATSPAPATFLQQRLPVLHKQLPVLHQRPPSCTSDCLLAPADTSDYQSWTSDHLPAPVDSSSHQFCTSNYQSWTSNHIPAPADTSNYQSWTSNHLPVPAETSLAPATIYPMNTSLVPAIQTCSSD